MNDEYKHKDVDILKELLPEIDKRNYQFFADLPKFYTKTGQEDPKKGVDFVPLLRWASIMGKEEVDWNEARRQGRQKGDGKGKWPSKSFDDPILTPYYVEIVNDIVNKHFWMMLEHPELLYKLFALTGSGENVNHIWIKAPKKKAKTKIIQMIKQLYPTANEKEIEMFIGMNDRNGMIELAQMMGYQDDEIAELKKELKEIYK